MNDLAEKALQGALLSYRVVRDHPMRSFAAAGLVAGTVMVLAGGQVAALAPSRPLTTWLGIASSRTADPGDTWPGAVLLAAVVTLAALWVALCETVRRQRQPLRRVWLVAGAWALPFVVGPPLMDTSVYSYVAYGRLVRLGHDPYRSSPTALGTSPIVAAIDPSTRGNQSSAGPLGTLLQHLVVSVGGGRLFGSLLVWRAVGVVAAFVIGRSAVRLASAPRGAALALCLPNPLVLLYVVSAPHLEGVTVALLLSAVVAARRRTWPSAVLFATLAGSVTATAFVAVPLLIAVHVRSRRDRRRLALLRDVTIAAVTVAATRLAVPDGFGWVRTARGQFDQHTPFAIADAVGRLIAPVVRGASYDDLAAGGRFTAAAAALAVVVYLTVTCTARSPEANVGFAMLALALLAPVLHPWYLMWGVLVFAPTALGARRTCVLALSVAGCVLDPPGFGSTTTSVLTGCALGVVAVVAGSVLLAQERRAAARDSATGDLADGRPHVGEVDARDHDRDQREQA